jgi:uncharacterized protein YndB with AHSA1/START domain
MYWILFVMALMASIVIAMIVGGLATPRAHTVSKSVVLAAPLNDVWLTIRTVSAYATWRSDLEDVELIDTAQSHVRWREMSTRRSMALGIVAEEAPHRLVVRILDEDLPFSGEWEWALRADGASTQVTVTERGEIGNPIFRLIGTYFIGHSKSIERVLGDLARRHG